jgi:hypothetical protein
LITVRGKSTRRERAAAMQACAREYQQPGKEGVIEPLNVQTDFDASTMGLHDWDLHEPPTVR